MARALRIQFPGAYYHLTCRGVEQRSIYEGDRDRQQFLVLLARSLADYKAVLHAYVLMINHFHLLIQTSKRIALNSCVISIFRILDGTTGVINVAVICIRGGTRPF